MEQVRFSIVIPTRERHETLPFTIKTCLAQKYDNYEIIICDNYSSPETKQVVDNFCSKKIKYVRSMKPLSMTDNWELAISHSCGEYIIFIGDDDGLLLHALKYIDNLINQFNAQVISWERVYYSWPSIFLKEYANNVTIPISNKIKKYNSYSIIKNVINYKIGYTSLPMLYNSAVHRSIIDIMYKQTGRVFHSKYPDLYSGYSIAYICKQYLKVGYPISINGGSAKSNGVATVVNKNENSIANEFFRLNTESGHKCDVSVPDIHEMPAIIADCFQHAKFNFFSNCTKLQLNKKKLLFNSYLALRNNSSKYSKEALVNNINAIQISLNENSTLEKYFQKIMNKYPIHQELKNDSIVERGLKGNVLILDASEFNVYDVFGIMELYEKLFWYDRDNAPQSIVTIHSKFLDFFKYVRRKLFQ